MKIYLVQTTDIDDANVFVTTNAFSTLEKARTAFETTKTELKNGFDCDNNGIIETDKDTCFSWIEEEGFVDNGFSIRIIETELK